MFIAGGLTGIFNGSAPAAIYISGTYFVVAHFHYTLFSALFFGGLAGVYYWFPKMFGRMLSAPLGHLHFWLTLIFFNVTFFPMHHLGLAGMVRRIANPLQYDALVPHQWINVVATYGTFCLLAAQIPFVINILWSWLAGKPAPRNPWNAATLEWSAPSPPPHLNWGSSPPVVYRGAYEYSAPDEREDWVPQDRAPARPRSEGAR
jgi:cytochrome c oxidase subunit 1